MTVDAGRKVRNLLMRLTLFDPERAPGSGTVTGTNSHRGSEVAAVLIRVSGLARREYVLQHSPLSAVHELCSGFAEPLCHAHREGHICHPCGAQVCQSAGRAVDLPCESSPSEA
jgi:hypothetical protein